MKDKGLRFDRTCHVLYTKSCKKEIQKKIALHYPPDEREMCGKRYKNNMYAFFRIGAPTLAAKRTSITAGAAIMTALR